MTYTDEQVEAVAHDSAVLPRAILMDMALCNSCGRYVSLARANGTVYGSTRIIGYRPDGEPVIYPIWRIDCYGGCVSEDKGKRARAALAGEEK